MRFVPLPSISAVHLFLAIFAGVYVGGESLAAPAQLRLKGFPSVDCPKYRLQARLATN